MSKKKKNEEELLTETAPEVTESIEEKESESTATEATENAESADSLKNTEVAEEPKEERTVVFEEALEAILFAAGHPISYATLARVFEMTPAKVRDLVFEYSLKYNDSAIPRGVILLTYGDSCQLCTKKYYLNEIREALGIKRSGTLSTSSLEALAIVAYNQPVTRAFVDTLRRADSSYAMNNLIDRGLIEAKGRLDAPGRPMLYGTTTDFLRAFGLKSVSELPTTTEEMDAMFAKAKSDEEAANEEALAEGVQEEIQFPEDGNIASTESEAATTETGSTEAVDEYENEPSAEDDIHYDAIATEVIEEESASDETEENAEEETGEISEESLIDSEETAVTEDAEIAEEESEEEAEEEETDFLLEAMVDALLDKEDE